MRTKRFHGLKRPKVRQSWNKINLYNLSRQRPPNIKTLTFYQQKWKAKSLASAYHTEHIQQQKWQRQFKSTLRSVVPMDHRYLATQDGAEQAEGRGSGKELSPFQQQSSRVMSPTPYMHMTFAPMERRLDTAIFRALFASSARQARQFVVHGGVKVNGKKMIHPGYLLNPGDMFQVEPDRVMFATGARKSDDKENRVEGLKAKRNEKFRNKNLANKADKGTSAVEAEPEATEIKTEVVKEADITTKAPEADEEHVKIAQKALFAELLQRVRDIQAQKDAPSANRKKELRVIFKSIRSQMSRMGRKTSQEVETDLDELMEKLTVATRPKGAPISTPKERDEEGDEEPKEEREKVEKAEKFEENQRTSRVKLKEGEISEEERDAVRAMMREAKDNPYDPSKPYATPWTPRPYMSAFTFIPRYLEVNQNICSAVYLRHPVARPGLAEVPTPFPYETSQLAYLWYLRRR